MALLNFSWKRVRKCSPNPFEFNENCSLSFFAGPHPVMKIQGLENNKNWSNRVCVCVSFLICEVCIALSPQLSVLFVVCPTTNHRNLNPHLTVSFNYLWAFPKYLYLYSLVLFSSCRMSFSFSPAIASNSSVCCWGSLYPMEDIPKFPRTLHHFCEAVCSFTNIANPIWIWGR